MNFLAEIWAGINKKNFPSPFIFIAAMPRSGSTLLSSMMSQKPEMVILSEPAFQRGECRELSEYSEIPGLSIQKIKPAAGKPREVMKGFKTKILPQILKAYKRVGVKECFLDNWEAYLEIFPKVKFVVLIRDPRDILLSTLDFGDHIPWHRQMWSDQTTDSIAERYRRTWEFQKEIMATQDFLAVRYEDLCSGQTQFDEIAKYCELSLKRAQAMDRSVTRSYPYRSWEVEKHGMNLSSKSIFRYREEKDRDRLRRAEQFAFKFRDYSKHWGYEA